MTRSLIALVAIAMLAVPSASFAAAKKGAKADPKKAEPAKVEPKPAADAAKGAADAGVPAAVDAGKPADAKPADAKPAETAKPEPKEWQKVGKLGLKFEGPKVSQSDMSGQVLCSDDKGVAFTVGPTSDFAAKTFEEAKLSKNDYSPTNVQKEEKLEDGWNIQFQNKGAMGDNFFVWIRRTIGGKAYQCETTSTTLEQAAKVEKICLSLSKQ